VRSTQLALLLYLFSRQGVQKSEIRRACMGSLSGPKSNTAQIVKLVGGKELGPFIDIFPTHTEPQR
jgi:hypothetical protein